MMTWSEKIKVGMKLMKEGCLENRSGVKCEEKCPFKHLCWYCTDEPQPMPEEWEIKDE